MRRPISRRSDSKLCFTGATDADPTRGAAGATAGLARKVRPGAGQPRQPVLVLRQLNLHRAFACAGMAGKDIEDQRRAVDDLDLLAQHLFQLALLAGREFVVKDDDIGAQLDDQQLELFELARADQRGRMWALQAAA